MPEVFSSTLAWRRRLGFGDSVRQTRRHSLDIKVLKHWQYDCHALDPLPEKPFWSLTPLSRCCNHFCHCNHCGHDCHNRPQCHTSDIVADQAWSFELPNSAHLLFFWRQTRKQQNEHCLKIQPGVGVIKLYCRSMERLIDMACSTLGKQCQDIYDLNTS